MRKISIIIPIYNESSSINTLINTLNEFFNSLHDFTTEVVFVNDGSTDDTKECLIASNFGNYDVKICNLSKNFGSHSALRAGIFHSTGDYTCFLYADLQDPIELIEQLYNEIKKGFQIVWAKRITAKNKPYEKLFSKIYASLMRKFVSNLFPSNGFDILMFDKKVKFELNRNVESNSSIFLQILTMGFNQSEIHYNKLNRKIGNSKWTISKKIKLLIDSFVAFSYFPIRVVSFIGIVFFLFGFIWSTYLIIRKLTSDDLASGWAALYSTLLMGFGVTNISLGIIAEYLWRTFDASRKRPAFIVNDIIEIDFEK